MSKAKHVEPDRLYILMRTDLASMNPGKAMAQANHAYGALKQLIRSKLHMQPRYLAWMEQTPQEFGTTVVLGATEGEIQAILKDTEGVEYNEVVAGWVHDPSYPLFDGDTMHLIPLDTCAFMFGRKSKIRRLTSDLSAHP